MRILVANRIVASMSEDCYSHTPKSLIFTRGELTAVDSFDLLSATSSFPPTENRG